MAAVHLLQPTLLFFFLSFLSTFVLSESDTDALLKLKKSFINTKSLDAWIPDSVPCAGEQSWVGVVCYNDTITDLRLSQMGLSGTIDIDALLEIPALRSVSFVNNAFSGPIPEFNRLGSIKAIYLSGNRFSGKIQSDYFEKMQSLKKVWLSDNGFTGEVPESLSKLPHLIELHLENNQFSGTIPLISQSMLNSFNVSNNKLEGEIPLSFSKFNMSSFAGNVGLCGTQVGKECNATGEGLLESSHAAAGEGTVKGSSVQNHKVVVAVVTLVLLFIALVAALIVLTKRRDDDFNILAKENLDEPVEVYMSSDSSRKGIESSWKGGQPSRKGSHHLKGSNHGKGTGMGDLVVVNDKKGIFGLQDLMKASAEVLGNGGLGSAYKAVMSNGVAVVVKRLRDMNRVGKDGFEAEMRRLGGLQHRNILTPLAYHYRKEEKLIVYEYVPKGSLLYLLHGDRGPSHAELDWPTRLNIVKGIAHGMGFLHTELASYDLPHGNLKSSNIFLDSQYEPLLSDYGFSAFVTPTQVAQTLFAYKSPETVQHHLVSSKCDVYSLGIVILEILTGKFPSQYLNNGKGGTDIVQWVQLAISERREFDIYDPEIVDSGNSFSEMEHLLHIGMACVEHDIQQRLEIKEAIRRIEEI